MGHAILPVAVHIFLEKDGKVLLMKRAGTGFQDGMWSVPAGRLDEHEPVTRGAVREAQEEVGTEIAKEDLNKPLTMHHKDERGERLYVFFICTVWKGEPINKEPEKCSEIKWFPKNELPETTVAHVKAAYEALNKDQLYLEYGF